MTTVDYDENIYYHPEKHGLTIVGHLSDPGACYSFDDLVVWQEINKDTGRIYWGIDAGCSCPSPFESFKGVSDLEMLLPETWDRFVAAVKNHCEPWDESEDAFKCDKNELLAKVNALLRPPTKREIEDAVAGLQRIAESLPR